VIVVVQMRDSVRLTLPKKRLKSKYVYLQMPGASGFAERGRQRVIAGMKKGGPVKETGLYMLHKGEVVVPASVVKGKSKKMDGKKK